jgi:hypothetical protein
MTLSGRPYKGKSAHTSTQADERIFSMQNDSAILCFFLALEARKKENEEKKE